MSQKFPVDVKQFAEVLGCEESTAYGFLRLLKEIGVVDTGKRPQPEGKKGKPATLYMLDTGVGERLAAYLAPKIAKLQPAEEPKPIVLAPEVVENVRQWAEQIAETRDGVLVPTVDESAGFVIG